jgi:hypothetical protein
MDDYFDSPVSSVPKNFDCKKYRLQVTSRLIDKFTNTRANNFMMSAVQEALVHSKLDLHLAHAS